MNIWTAFVATGLIWTASLAQPQSAEPLVSSASWLAGRWVGEGLGGTVEETWAPAAGGKMIGYFQLVKGGKPEFYELMMLDAEGGRLRIRVKHFDPSFIAWEDKDRWHTFELLAVEPDRLKFEGLTIARAGDELTTTITLRTKEGVVRDHAIRLRRAPL